ncbi:hypothetical protein [Neobacillus mesonae]|uniref:hypothetical protein n=1 Tax=Neobacillus mesonae TaxID=1193713 RepID=UPI00203B3192|nr:hypothetical protein [Neobacillus mesonae]MCM3567760.1 hypothetical protein [Neobacillus mesonae]
MEVIQIGSFAISLKWLLLGLALIAGVGIMKQWLSKKQEKDIHKGMMELLFNSLFLGFMIWKGSLFLLEPSLVMKSPLSLLYFSGGSNGLMLAIIGSIMYFLLKGRKNHIPNLILLQFGFLFSFSAMTFYYLLTIFFLKEYIVSHIILGLFTAIMTIIMFFKQQMVTQKNIFTSLILFSFLHLLLSFTVETLDKNLFSMDQLFFICLIIVSLVYWDKRTIS